MQRRDFIAASAAIGAGLLAPARAQTAPKRGGTLIWGHSETAQSLDVHLAGAAASGRVLQNIHCTLIQPDHTFKLVPMLAESFETSPDLLSYTFKLRPNVTFHDGRAMTAADVKYSFDRVRDPKNGAVNFEVFQDVDTIETLDDHTVIVKMKRVNAPFLDRISENGAGAILPAGSGETQAATPIGAGPFKFVRREFGHETELARFDGYWEGPAYLDRVIEREVVEPTVRLTGLQTGELQLINDIPPDHVDTVARQRQIADAEMVSAQLRLPEHEPQVRAVRRPARAPRLRPHDRQGPVAAGRAVEPGQAHRLAELPHLELLRRRAA